MATGTVSGYDAHSFGSGIEYFRTNQTIDLGNGVTRTWLEDGDTVIITGEAAREGKPRIGFGECVGTVIPAHPN
jgi:fumarylacetoacetase